MSDALRQRYDELLVETVLDRYPGLRLVPSRGDSLRLAGNLAFNATGPGGEVIEDQYDIEVSVSHEFPLRIPGVRETAGRIAADFHKLEGGLLCLGAPTVLRLKLGVSPTLLTFVEQILIPYLYGHSYFLKHGTMPYGELAHGDAGIRAEIAELFGSHSGAQPEEFLRLAGLQKRRANKQSCPCDSGLRLGRCHNRRVNSFRDRLGRIWCRNEYKRVVTNLTSRRKIESRLFPARIVPQSVVKRDA